MYILCRHWYYYRMSPALTLPTVTAERQHDDGKLEAAVAIRWAGVKRTRQPTAQLHTVSFVWTVTSLTLLGALEVFWFYVTLITLVYNNNNNNNNNTMFWHLFSMSVFVYQYWNCWGTATRKVERMGVCWLVILAKSFSTRLLSFCVDASSGVSCTRNMLSTYWVSSDHVSDRSWEVQR